MRQTRLKARAMDRFRGHIGACACMMSTFAQAQPNTDVNWIHQQLYDPVHK